MKGQLKPETQERLKETIFQFADRAHFGNLWDLRRSVMRSFVVILDEEEIGCHGVDMLLRLPEPYRTPGGVGKIASILTGLKFVAKIYVPDMMPDTQAVKFIRARIVWKGPGEDITELDPPMLDPVEGYKGFDRTIGPDGPDIYREDNESFRRNTTMYTRTKIEIKQRLCLPGPVENIDVVFHIQPGDVQF